MLADVKVLIIVNPISGSGMGRVRGEELKSVLEKQRVRAELFTTAAKGDAERAAQETDADYVAAVGGDGSANEVANGIANSGKAMAILPLGTANVLAAELGCPHNPQQTADIILDGYTRTIDRGIATERCFVMGAGAGLDAAIVDEVSAHRGSTLGYMAYVAPVLNKLTHYNYPQFTVRIDSETVCDHAQYVVVGNCRYTAGVLCLTPDALVDDGLFDVCIFHDLNSMKMIRLAAASFAPGFSKSSEIIYRKGREIDIIPNDNNQVPVQIDGDPAGTLPARFRIDPAALKILVPRP